MLITEIYLQSLAQQARLDLDTIPAPATACPAANALSPTALLVKRLTAMETTLTPLSCVDTGTTQALFSPAEYTSPLREDVSHQPISVKEILENAPEKNDTFFVVPPLL